MAESQGDETTGGTRGGQYSGPAAHVPEPVHDHHDDPAFITRTRFLTGVALVTGGVMTAAILVPVVGFAAADALKEEEWQWVDVGPLSDFPDGQTTSIAVSGPCPESDRRAFVRHKDGAMIAIWNRCAHLGCPVELLAPAPTRTPARATAAPTTRSAASSPGPPPRPLDRFDVKIVDRRRQGHRPPDDAGRGRARPRARARTPACSSAARSRSTRTRTRTSSTVPASR